MSNIAVSPCSNPELGLEEALAAYADLGYTKFEAFTGWVQSAFDYHGDPQVYKDLGTKYGLAFSSLHLPPVGDDRDITEAVAAAQFAEELGAPVVLFKATSRENYIAAAGPFLDAIEGFAVTPVLQNHAGSPISSLADFAAVLEGIGDVRMKTLLEVGHFHSVGVPWTQGARLLGDTIALAHIKDQIGAQSVPFGQGEIDLPALFAYMGERGYRGDYVVEMEVEDSDNTLGYLADARRYLAEHCPEARL
jgi:sugar phosphate isomerase/epimerase